MYQCHCNVEAHFKFSFFASRICDIWNALRESVVEAVPTSVSKQSLIDKFHFLQCV